MGCFWLTRVSANANSFCHDTWFTSPVSSSRNSGFLEKIDLGKVPVHRFFVSKDPNVTEKRWHSVPKLRRMPLATQRCHFFLENQCSDQMTIDELSHSFNDSILMSGCRSTAHGLCFPPLCFACIACWCAWPPRHR